MTLSETTHALREKLSRLEDGPSATGDWHRLGAAAARAIIAAQNEIALVQTDMLELVKAAPPDRRWYAAKEQLHQIRGLIEELRLIKLCAESRLFEIAAEQDQSSFRTAP